MQITEMNKHSAMTISDRMKSAMASIEEELGVTFDVQRSSISGASVNMKVTVSLGDEIDLKDTPEGRAYHYHASSYGLDREWLGQTFRYVSPQGQVTIFQIIGLKTSRPKFPVSAVRVSDGQPFKFPARVVKEARS